VSWALHPISEVCSHAVDCVNRTAPIVEYETPYKMLRTTNIKGGFVDTENVRFVTLETYERWTRRLVPQRGDVFLTREAPLGDVGRLTSDDKVFLGQRLFHYRANPELMDARFLAYVLQTAKVQGWIKGLGMGATVEHARVGDFHKIPVPTPPLDVQVRIGDILSAYDDLIENNRRRIALLEEAQMLYREWFVRFRFPAHEHVKIIDDTPEGWEILPASEAFEVNPATPRSDDGDIIYVPMAALSETGMVIDRTQLELRTAATSVRFRVADTLFARITPCLENGKTGFVQFLATNEVACGSTEFIVLRGRRVSNSFVYLTSRQDTFRENAIKSMIGSSGRQQVQPSCFDRYLVPIPPGVLAPLFDDAVAPMFDQITNLDQQNQKLALARDLLLPRLMNGEIAA
jgi:type I restriction enzyme, S subunit